MSHPNLVGPSHLGPPPPDGDVNRGPVSFQLSLAFTVISTVVLAFRFVARGYGRWNYGWDDWTMLLAFLIATAKFGCSIVGLHHGTGRHIYYLSLADAEVALKIIFIDQFLSLLAICLVKVSVALFLLRIGNLRRWLKLALIANTAILVASTVAFSVILFVQCRPIEANWNLLIRAHAKCINAGTLIDVSYLTTAISILTDFVCAALPFPILWDLKINRRTKNSVRLLMCLGFLAAICGIVRITHVKDLKGTNDPTFASIILGDWTTGELYIGIIVGSIPPCRVLFMKLWAIATAKPDPEENTIGMPNGSGSGRSIILENLSKVGRVFSRSPKTSPTGTAKGSGSGWQNLETTKHATKDYDTSNASSRNLVDEENTMMPMRGITKTVGVTVTQGGLATPQEAYSVGRPKAAESNW